MRRATLLLGVLYLLWSIWQYFTVSRILSLYEQFNANTRLPASPYFIPILIFAMAVIFIGGYFANFKNQVSYKILATLGALGIIVYFLFIFIWGSVANSQVYQKLNEAGLQQ